MQVAIVLKYLAEITSQTENSMNIEREIFELTKTIAVVGLSPQPDRPSNQVAAYLQKQGYRIIPVNPKADQILGEKCYPDLVSIPEKIDLVDIFRRSEDIPPIIEDAIRKGIKAIWMQEGITNESAAKRAREAGLLVVMNKCAKMEHKRIFGKKV